MALSGLHITVEAVHYSIPLAVTKLWPGAGLLTILSETILQHPTGEKPAMSRNATFILLRLTACLIAVLVLASATGVCFAQDPVGDWRGTLDVGMAKLRAQLHIAKESSGAYTATLDSIDQGSSGIPIEKIVVSDKSFKFELPKFGVSYQGTFSEDGSKIEGTLSQAGQSSPLVFERGSFDLPATQKRRPMTGDERDTVVAHLERTRKLFEQTLSGVTLEQWSFKPAPDRWSLAEIAEHITKMEDLLRGFVTGQVVKIPTPPDFAELTADQYKEADAKVLAQATDRSQKGQAVEATCPAGIYKTVDEALQAFAEKRAQTIEYARTTQDDLRAHSTPDRKLTRVDGYQYLLMMAGHAERHVAQMIEVKTATGYPR